VGWLVGVVILLAAGPLFGQADPNRILVYHSDSPGGDPIEEQIAEIATDATDTLELYIVKGDGDSTISGTRCVDGDGQETCGFEIRLEALADFLFTSFTPAGPAIRAKMLLAESEVAPPSSAPFFGDFDELRVNGTKTQPPWNAPSPESVYIGSLGVSTSADPLSNDRMVVTRGRHVDAAGLLAGVPPHVIAVPEAPRLSMLLAGALLLEILQRRRRRKLARRACA
jgi:hypothetical protein